jgi:hypothetical protein
MTNQWSADTVFDVFADETARQIIVETAAEPKSAAELGDICDCSLSAVYRRIDVMTGMELLEEQNWITEDGGHCNVYSAASTTLELEITADGVDVTDPEATGTDRPVPRLSVSDD